MSIFFCETCKTFFLDGKDLTYAFRINPIGYAEHLYFGKKIPHEDLAHIPARGANAFDQTAPRFNEQKMSYQKCPPELSFFGTGDYREACVHTENAQGDRLTELLYVGHEILQEKPAIAGMPSMRGGETLVLHLADRITAFAADLYYTVYPDVNVIARHIVYRNGGKSDVRLLRAYSFSLPLPGNRYDFLALHGAWAMERTVERVPLHYGVTSIDSKRTTSSSSLNPFLALPARDAGEETGEVIGVSLVYSSSYVLKAEVATNGETLVTGGINDFDFAWKLGAGEEFATPEAVIAYSDAGLGGMSRTFHDAFRAHLINPRFVKSSRPVVINNWEATSFRFTEEKLKAIASAIAGTGVDTFVLDDGWFGKREDASSGLGDWYLNREKLPGGFTGLTDHLHSIGMRFGLWFEPEMISEDSDLYRAHPDWAIHVPGRELCHGRNQLMLDLTRAEVRDYIVDTLNGVIRENRIGYVKWDYNRNVTESFSLGREADRQKEFAHRYALGVYDLCERIVSANPDVFFEGCSGGGARFDPAMLYYFPQIWTSDNTDAEERTRIQYGTSLVYPLSAMSCHVSICPNHQTNRTTPFSTRGVIAGLGAMGYELDTTAFTDEDRDAVRAQITEYRATEDLILNGDLYRLDDPFTSNYMTFEVVAKDRTKAEMICYRTLDKKEPIVKRVYPKGLDPERRYTVPELEMTHSGAVWMYAGIIPSLPKGDFEAIKYHFNETK